MPLYFPHQNFFYTTFLARRLLFFLSFFYSTTFLELFSAPLFLHDFLGTTFLTRLFVGTTFLTRLFVDTTFLARLSWHAKRISLTYKLSARIELEILKASNFTHRLTLRLIRHYKRSLHKEGEETY